MLQETYKVFSVSMKMTFPPPYPVSLGIWAVTEMEENGANYGGHCRHTNYIFNYLQRNLDSQI